MSKDRLESGLRDRNSFKGPARETALFVLDKKA